jgi:dihydrolipoamide dehydrogenase
MSASTSFDIAVIGGGSAAEAFLREVAGSGRSVVIFEPNRVGGECPFVACMPSKAMLHDASEGSSWNQAVERRGEITDHLDDSEHIEEAEQLGATIVRAAATLLDEHTIEADGRTFVAEHIVLATGVTPVLPDIDGIDQLGDLLWTSEDALVATDRPERLTIIGGGVIGSEVAQIFVGFDTDVTVIDHSERPADDLHPKVGEMIADSLQRAGVDLRYGDEAVAFEIDRDGAVRTSLASGSVVYSDVVLVVVGRTPTTEHLNLAGLGLDPTDLDVHDNGRIGGTESMWAMGDVAGRQQYTHLANRHAAVVANHIVGDGTRSFDEAVVPACIFITPPVMVVGPTWSDLVDDDDVVWAEVNASVPRRTTDDLAGGFLAVAARRSTGTIVAAHGIGPKFDELVHGLVIAIDGEVPVSTLARTIQPFPTIGEVLGLAFEDLRRQLAEPA